MSAKSGLPDDIGDPKLRQLYEYWATRRGDAPFPTRNRLDPLDMRFILGDLALVDVDRSSWTFRYRLVGTNYVTRSGYDMTGKTVDEIPERSYRERIRKIYLEVCQTGIPAHGSRNGVADGKLRRHEFLVLPLSSKGAEIDMLMVAQREPSRA